MTVALILAAGRGERLGGARPKALVELAGRPLLQWSIEALRDVAEIETIVVALPAGAPAPDGVTVVQGGDVRSASVLRALAAAPSGDPVLVHDAARPLVTPELAESVIAALLADPSADGAIAAAPVTDTVKRVGGEGIVRETLDRGELWAVQTPQVFRRAALERALDVAPEVLAQATDDASLVERSGGRVIVVRAGPENLKVTTPLDLDLAAMLLSRRRPSGV
ncbi:MAG TPA: 2-C-methyl-D-erythritol 4-phosphate cytidylyltransferase [Solirubrobacteraceae bacterium]|jgi:2-C-methyl-D-erythritol 4-phosphate cytidylyltransferase|nr:2-C-methyl-D-erythritol 4-phosphate cytidylyltransferase [Solirubrobacteraceae bacterium]